MTHLHDQRRQALDLLATGASQREAARQAGVSEGGLRRWLAQLTPRERAGLRVRRVARDLRDATADVSDPTVAAVAEQVDRLAEQLCRHSPTSTQA